MEVTLIKKIKVMLKGEASSFGYEEHSYKPGDIFMIEESKFVPYLMEKVGEPKKKMEDKRVVVTTEGIETLGPSEEPSAPEIKATPIPEIEEASSEGPIEQKILPKRRRRTKKA